MSLDSIREDLAREDLEEKGVDTRGWTAGDLVAHYDCSAADGIRAEASRRTARTLDVLMKMRAW